MHFAFFFYVIVIVSALLRHTEQFDAALETLTIVEGSVLDTGTIVVDGIDAVVEEFGDLRRVFDAQADESKDADFCCQAVFFLGVDLHLGLE